MAVAAVTRRSSPRRRVVGGIGNPTRHPPWRGSAPVSRSPLTRSTRSREHWRDLLGPPRTTPWHRRTESRLHRCGGLRPSIVVVRRSGQQDRARRSRESVADGRTIVDRAQRVSSRVEQHGRDGKPCEQRGHYRTNLVGRRATTGHAPEGVRAGARPRPRLRGGGGLGRHRGALPRRRAHRDRVLVGRWGRRRDDRPHRS